MKDIIMTNYKRKFNLRVAQLMAAGLTMSAAMAQAAIDVSAVTTGVTEAAVAVGVIGAAVTLVVLGIKVFKWAQRSL